MIDKIKSFGKKYVAPVIIGGAMILSCSKDSPIEPLPEQEPEAKYILHDKLKIASSGDLEKITQLTDSTITYSQAMNYSKGDLLAGGIGPNSPNGYLREVRDISDNKIITKNISLEDVIKKGDFYFNKRLTMNDLENKSKSKLKSGDGIGYEFNYPIKDLVVFDLDKDTLTTNDQIILRGDIYFNASAEMDAEFDYGIKKFRFGTKIDGGSDLEVEARLSFPAISERLMVYEQTCNPISIPGPLGIPIIVRPNFQIYVGIDGSFDAKAIANVHAYAGLENDLIYEDKNWALETTLTKEFDFSIPEAYLETELDAYGGTRLDLILYESLGPYGQIEEHFKLNVDTKKNPWWELWGGIEAKVGVDMGILGNMIPNYEKIIYESEELLGQAENNSPPEIKFSATPLIGEAPLQVNMDLSQSTSENPINLYLFDFGDGKSYTEEENSNDGLFDGKAVHLYNTPGTYWAKGSVTNNLGLSGKDSLEVKVLSGWKDVDLDSDDGSIESSFGWDGRCLSYWDSEYYFMYKTLSAPRYPFKMEKVAFYFESAETEGKGFELTIEENNVILGKTEISSDGIEFPGWYEKTLDEPIIFEDGPVTLRILEEFLPLNCEENPEIHGWKIGLDEDSSGNSISQEVKFKGFSGTNEKTPINGELMIRAKGKIKEE